MADGRATDEIQLAFLNAKAASKLGESTAYVDGLKAVIEIFVPDLIISADGPLSVQCAKCRKFIGGTTYPVTEMHTRSFETLRKTHAPQCAEAVR